MTDFTSLGYPQGYHLGLSSVLWWICIVVTTILGIALYLNARKTDLINVKETLRAKSFFYICISIQISLIQVAVFFPDIFLQFNFTGGVLISFSIVIYLYYWEKNLTSIKRIPTIFAGAGNIGNVIGFMVSIFFPDLPNFFWDFLILTALLLVTISFVLYIYLIYAFSKNVKGVSTKVIIVWMGGVILSLISLLFEYAPGVRIFPTFVVFYVSPIFYMIGNSMAVYGITRLFPQISSFYAQSHRCAVHRGTIEKGNPIHYCSSCGIVYCETCFNQVIIKDGCWNCLKGVELENEKEKIIDDTIELDKKDKIKSPHKNAN